MTTDPIELLRDYVADVPAPNEHDVGTQRARLHDAISTAEGRRTRSRRMARRRWLPASGVAVAVLAASGLVVVALQPSGSNAPGPDDKRSPRSKLELAGGIAGGAFSGLDLEQASAAEVLEAAGNSAAAGTPVSAGTGWTYALTESGGGGTDSRTERWLSPDGERSFSISTSEDASRRKLVSIHYEYLRDETIGDVSWITNSGAPGPRRATWNTDAGDGAASVDRVVRLADALEGVSDKAGVQQALDTVLDDADLTYSDGMACNPNGQTCIGIGASMPGVGRVGAAESKQMFERGLLLQVLVGSVYPKETTRAMYELLASMPGADVAPAGDGSNDVVLRYLIDGTRPAMVEVATLDGESGRIVAWGPSSEYQARWIATGVAIGPVEGGVLCEEFRPQCRELRQLAEDLKADPDATFHGVRDWMRLSQVCDGLIREDGSVIEDAGPPKSASSDPAVRAEAKACMAT